MLRLIQTQTYLINSESEENAYYNFVIMKSDKLLTQQYSIWQGKYQEQSQVLEALHERNKCII